MPLVRLYGPARGSPIRRPYPRALVGYWLKPSRSKRFVFAVVVVLTTALAFFGLLHSSTKPSISGRVAGNSPSDLHVYDQEVELVASKSHERDKGDAAEATTFTHPELGADAGAFRREAVKVSAPHPQGYAFKAYEPNSVSHKDVDYCPGLQTDLGSISPIDPRFNFLLILGAQKAGTTWLFDALATHPLFVGAHHGYKRRPDKWRKEVHYFDQWPLGPSQEYLSCFNAPRRLAALAGAPSVFVDASPEYLLTPAAAPRAQRVLPHAKFVIVLRDPVARTISAWRMVQRNVCGAGKGKSKGEGCSLPRFHDVVLQETRPGGKKPPGCLFDGTEEARKSWGDCWRCQHTVPKQRCKYLPREETSALGNCPPNGPPTSHVALYAAQISWWLNFFPPDRFLILTSAQLRHPSTQIHALNKVLQHVGRPEGMPFTPEQIADISGFQGNYSKELSADDEAAAAELRRFFRKPNADLQAIMDTHFPSAGFRGFEEEF